MRQQRNGCRPLVWVHTSTVSNVRDIFHRGAGTLVVNIGILQAAAAMQNDSGLMQTILQCREEHKRCEPASPN